AMDTMNWWIERTREELLKTIAVVDALIINDAEARELADEPNLVRAARKILSWGPQMLVGKRGEYGADLFTLGSFFSIPAYAVEDVLAPTHRGAGCAARFL